MAIILVTGSKHPVTVEDRPFAKGGEGKIHKIITSPSAYRDCCVKLYELKYRTPERQNKIAFLIQNRPAHLQNNDYMVCFPKELVFLNNQFAGFIMPLAFKDSVQLEALCTPGIRPTYKHHQKFDRKLPDAFKKRLQLCLNLAVPVHLVHSINKYVFVDIKPQNILVSPDGKISVIDIDSLQIANNQQVIHPAQVNTPDYCPPESWNISKGKYIPVTSDRFAVAVIFYQVLFGIHPYTASFKGGYAHVTEIAEIIKNGLFVHGHHASYIANLPPPHQAFHQLDAKLQGLFIAAFELGLYDPSKRPTVDQWGQAFYDVLHLHSPIKAPPIAAPAPIKPTPAPIPPTPPQKKTPISVPDAGSKPAPTMVYAGFWRRLGAFLLDLLILMGCSFVVAVIVASIAASGMGQPDEAKIALIISIICVIITWLYYSAMESSLKQATFGKMALGIKVTDLRGNGISFDKAAWRCFCAFILFIISIFNANIFTLAIAVIGFVMVVWTEKQQALHDKIARCLVVKK